MRQPKQQRPDPRCDTGRRCGGSHGGHAGPTVLKHKNPRVLIDLIEVLFLEAAHNPLASRSSLGGHTNLKATDF